MKKFALLFLVLAACVDEPFEGTWYRCEAQLVCDSRRFDATGLVCSDEPGAPGDYTAFSAAWAEHQGVECEAFAVENVRCANTTTRCSYYGSY